MSDFGLRIVVREGDDAGPVIEGAQASGTLLPAATGADGIATVEGFLLTVEKEGYAPYVAQPYMHPSLGAVMPISLQLLPPVPPTPPLPPIPSRDQLCHVQCSFQGLTVQTQQYGVLPLFDPVIGWFTGPTAAADRAACYAAHKAVGDTHINLAVSSQYDEPGQAYAGMPGRDFTNDLDAFRALLTEAIHEGFYILLMMAGDGEEPDPVGLTKGRTWLMQNFERIVTALRGDGTPVRPDLTPYIVFCPGYDGVVPGWQPPSGVDAFVQMARGVLGPQGALAIELSAGYCVWAGNEFNNWATPAGQCVDVILSEFPCPMGPPQPCPADPAQRSPWDQVWQIVGRLVRPYHRPADQPANDDPSPPYYLGSGTPRGPYVYVAWEFDTYAWVRGCSVDTVHTHREYLKSLGCPVVG